MRRDDQAYYRDRAIAERLAARHAPSGAARKVHGQLAAMYRFRAAMLSDNPAEWTGSVSDEDSAGTH